MKNEALFPRPGNPNLRSGIATMVLVGAIGALYFAREILIPFAFALALTFLLAPVATMLQRLRLGRVVSVLLTMLASIAVACGIGWIIASQLVDVANQLPLYRQNIHAKIAAFHLPVTGQLSRAAQSLEEIGRELSGSDGPTPPAPSKGRNAPQPAARAAAPMPVRVVPPETSGWTELHDWGTPVLGPLGRAGIILIFTVFMLFKTEDLRNRLVRLVGLGQMNLTTQALDDASVRVS